MANSPTQVHVAIDTYMALKFVGDKVINGNIDAPSYSQGTDPFIKQSVVFKDVKQFELGNINSARHYGYVLFIIHSRRGTGHADRDRLWEKVVKSFRSQIIGGATFLNVKLLTEGQTETWAITSLQVPFYFTEI